MKVCAVAGEMAAGADCAESNTGDTSEMDLPAFVDFLEPGPSKDAAVCLSSGDYMRIENAIEQACKKLSGGCTADTQTQITQVETHIAALRARARKASR